MCSFFIFFFFSSRRRHTRSLRDWSSDVCSSDLDIWPVRAQRAQDVLHVAQRLTGLGSQVAGPDESAVGIEGDLAGNERQPPAGGDSMRIPRRLGDVGHGGET